MKRSEIEQIIEDRIVNWDKVNGEIWHPSDIAIYILMDLEKAGMLPPDRNFDCKCTDYTWDPEDESM